MFAAAWEGRRAGSALGRARRVGRPAAREVR